MQLLTSGPLKLIADLGIIEKSHVSLLNEMYVYKHIML